MDSTLSMAAPKQITRMDFRCLHRGTNRARASCRRTWATESFESRSLGDGGEDVLARIGVSGIGRVFVFAITVSTLSVLCILEPRRIIGCRPRGDH